ncbi:MAG TPA: hypothetical protein VM056_02330 [Terriglobales bacterium]|nr:hypothetical protein [Terriglobales bacterium]
MKSRLLTLSFVLLLSLNAFAGSGNFTVVEDTTIHGKALKAGEYKLKWNDAGEFTVLQNNKEVLTSQGQLVEQANRASQNAIVKQVATDGTSRVTEFRFAGKKTTLVVGQGEIAKKQ